MPDTAVTTRTARAYEAVDRAAWTYFLERHSDNVRDARNTLPLNTPLCNGCDSPLDGNCCHECELVFMDMSSRVFL